MKKKNLILFLKLLKMIHFLLNDSFHNEHYIDINSTYIENLQATSDNEKIIGANDKFSSSKKNEKSLNDFSIDIKSVNNKNNWNIIDNLEYSINFEDNREISTKESLDEPSENPFVTDKDFLESTLTYYYY